MFGVKLIVFPALCLSFVVESQIPISIPSPPIISASQILPPNIVSLENPPNIIATADTTSQSTSSSQASSPTSQPQAVPTQSSSPTSTPQGTPSQSPVGASPPPNGTAPPTGGPGGPGLTLAPMGQAKTANGTQSALQPNGPRANATTGAPQGPFPPTVPGKPMQKATNSSAKIGVSIDVDETQGNGTLPNITLIVSNVSNGTRINIRNNNKNITL